MRKGAALGSSGEEIRASQSSAVPIAVTLAGKASRKNDSSAGPQTGKLGQMGRDPKQNSSKSAPVIEKTMFNMCFYPQGVHRIKVLALGPLLAVLIFQGSQMTLMTTKMAMFFRQKN